jgi:hypothetical protein
MAKRKINKSEKIREFITANPDVGPSEVARQVSEQTGAKVSAAFVSTIKQKMKGGNGKAKRGRPGRVTGDRIGNGKASDALSVIKAAQQFIAVAGGHANAVEIISALEGSSNHG